MTFEDNTTLKLERYTTTRLHDNQSTNPHNPVNHITVTVRSIVVVVIVEIHFCCTLLD